MDENRPMTKRELKALRKLENLDRKNEEGANNKVKFVIFGLAAILFIAFFGFLIYLAKQSSEKPVALSDSGWVRGASDAKVTLTEFGDFQCPACKTYYPIVHEILSSYKDKSFRLVFKHFPLTAAHKNALAASLAAEAAGAQNKFFEMHDVLYEKQDEWAMLTPTEARDKFISYANELKLDEDKFLKDLDNKDLENKIHENQNEGIAAGVGGTPTFFLNGKPIESPRSVEDFKKIIDEELK